MQTKSINIPFLAFSSHIRAINIELRKWRAECELQLQVSKQTKFEKFYGDDPGAPSVVMVDELGHQYILKVYQQFECPPVEMPWISPIIISSPWSLIQAGKMITTYLNAEYEKLSKEEKKDLAEYQEEDLERLPL